MQGPNSNMLTKDDLSRAFALVKIEDRLEDENSQQPYMLKDEATIMEEDGALFGNGTANEPFEDDEAILPDGIYQETDVSGMGQIVTAEGEMEPLPDPAFYPQTTAAMYGMGEEGKEEVPWWSLTAIKKGISEAGAAIVEAAKDVAVAAAKTYDKAAAAVTSVTQSAAEGKATPEQVDQVAATADAAKAVAKEAVETAKKAATSPNPEKVPIKTAEQVAKDIQVKTQEAKATRTAARAAGKPILATTRIEPGFMSKYGLWIALGGTLLVGGGLAAYFLTKRKE